MQVKASFTAHTALTALLAASLFASAQADTYHVNVSGTVDYNIIGGGLTKASKGTVVNMDFNVDSTNYTDSVALPGVTRGYAIDLSSFTLTLAGGVTATLAPGQGPENFVLRNNDPKVDGVFFSSGTDLDNGFLLNPIAGVSVPLSIEFLRTFNGNAGGGIDKTFKSVSIADAVGSYGWNNVSTELWALSSGGIGAEFIPTTLTISAAVPEPESYGLMLAGLVAIGAMARRRRG